MSCGICNKPSVNDFVSYTTSYYRNKGYPHHFCSDECMKQFNATKKCKFCSYADDLVTTTEGFMVCTSDEYWKYSCNDRYKVMQKYGLDHNITLNDNDMEWIMQKEYLPEHLENYVTKPDVYGLLMRIRELVSNVSELKQELNDMTKRVEALENDK